MSSQSVKKLGVFVPAGIFDKGLGARLPEAYKKFYKEWKLTEPTAVHYVPNEGRWRRDEVTGEVFPVQNIPIPLRFPPESHEQIWGGEGVIQGFLKKHKIYKRRVPHFWFPQLQRSVVYSEVLDKYMSVVVTPRTINLINENYGFDHYILKTPACDLQSLLALGLKRKILQELEKGCPTYVQRPEKQSEILERYKQYLASYTSEEIEWYGYSYIEACKKLQASIEAATKIIPLKQIYRGQLIEKLKAAGIREATEEEGNLNVAKTWVKKLNPFSKKET